MAVFDNSEYRQQRLVIDTEQPTLDERSYNLVIGGVVLWGLALNALMATWLREPILQLNYTAVLIAYFVVSLASTALVYRSDSPALSFVGFTGLSLSMGLLLTFIVSAYDGGSIRNAFIATAAVTACMISLAGVYPTVFLRMGRSLFIALLIALVVDLLCLFLLHVDFSLIDAAVVLIFAGYLGFDWARAQTYPKTLDNAVDSAADIYVDIINIFIRILRIMGKRKN